MSTEGTAYIKGGYILQPRLIEKSDISYSPPHVREIWNYLLLNANSSDARYKGYNIKRGELFRSYQDIRDALSWKVGYRTERYSEGQMKSAMKFLRDTKRITTSKQLGGVLITICNYEYYQNPKNYEKRRETTNDESIYEPLPDQPLADNNKKKKNEENEKKEIEESFEFFFDEYHRITRLAKTDKKAALKKWKALTKAERIKAVENISLFYDSLENKKYCKKARTYLEDKNFNDEFAPSLFQLPIKQDEKPKGKIRQ